MSDRPSYATIPGSSVVQSEQKPVASYLSQQSVPAYASPSSDRGLSPNTSAGSLPAYASSSGSTTPSYAMSPNTSSSALPVYASRAVGTPAYASFGGSQVASWAHEEPQTQEYPTAPANASNVYSPSYATYAPTPSSPSAPAPSPPMSAPQPQAPGAIDLHAAPTYISSCYFAPAMSSNATAAYNQSVQFQKPPSLDEDTEAANDQVADAFSKPPPVPKPTVSSAPKPADNPGGLFSKLTLKAGQMTSAVAGIAKKKYSDVANKLRAETTLYPPAGGWISADYEQICEVTRFNRLEEIEYLYYEFKRHVHVPDPSNSRDPFTPTMNFTQFQRFMPPCFPPQNSDHYNLVVQSFFKVFKWGRASVSFETFVRAMSVICRGSPEDKLPMLFDVFMDPVQRFMSPNSLRFVLGQLSQLGLACAGVGNAVPTEKEIDYLVQDIFQNHGKPVGLDQFRQLVLTRVAGKQPPPPWAMLMDGFGVFPYIYFNYFYQVEQILAKSNQLMTRQPHKEGFLIKFNAGAVVGDAWTRHWAIIDRGCMWYYSSDNSYSDIRRVLNLGGAAITLSQNKNDPPYCFVLETSGETRKFCAETEEALEQWIHVIELNRTQGRYVNHSFSPVREGISGRWFIDGEDTYRLMAEVIEKAVSEVFITDWFFSPQVYMRRFDENGKICLKLEDRLDEVLRRKANQGVRFYVLPWSETKIAIDLGSANVKAVLEGIHPNIKVLCHPLVTPIKWSHHQKTIIVDQKIAFVGGLDTCFGRWDTQQHTLTDYQEPYLYPGKDYYNPAVAEFSNVPNFEEELVNRQMDPRMPWHDIHMMCDGEAARDVAANFIQRWNHHRDALNEHNHITPQSSFLPPSGRLSVQVVRSVCNWSAGVSVAESSILNAYIAEIERAEHFIYIENQFFISSLAGGVVENRIAEAILKKVFDAAEAGRVFRVIIIVPVHPEGSYKEGATVRYIMGWQFKTICRGKRSMVQQFHEKFPHLCITDYMNFYIVKKWDRLNDYLVSEQIYVHAKLMIVDDRTVITGSANINDRSMLGVRDSEIAVVVKDREMRASNMNGTPWQVARFAHELRCNLFLEHLGIPDQDINLVRDPTHPGIYTRWVETARNNARIFDEVFDRERRVDYTPEKLRTLSGICGHIADYNQQFLTDAEMSAKPTDIDIMVTTDDVFT